MPVSDAAVPEFMSRVLDGDAHTAWGVYERMVVEDEQIRTLIRMLAERGDAMLEESRRVWRARGFERAPFDFLFGGES
jgi:hypothetical protein